jgi:hypothetical protein
MTTLEIVAYTLAAFAFIPPIILAGVVIYGVVTYRPPSAPPAPRRTAPARPAQPTRYRVRGIIATLHPN